MRLTKNAFLDWLYFERRARVTFEANAHKQKIYTAKNEHERITFGKASRTAPLVIRWIKYKPNRTPDTIKFFANYRDTIKALTRQP